MKPAADIKQQFQEKGYTVVRNLFSDTEITYYKEQLDALSVGKKEKWTQPDGVCQHPAFWDVLFNPKILSTVRALFDQPVKFLQHNDLHVGFSSYHWHRDSVCRTFGKGPDWDESTQPYNLVRVGIYLQESTGGFRLGMIKGSNRPQERMEEKDHRFLNKQMGNLNKAVNIISGSDPLGEMADWVKTEPGDCIVFDPRTMHTGSEFQGTKYSFFVAYGVENMHFRNHYNYYRHLRQDLNYQGLQPELVERLRAADLYADESASDQPIEGAWLPSKLFTAVAKQFK